MPALPVHPRHLSSSVVIAPSLRPVPAADVTLTLRGQVVDLAARVLVAGVVPAPRFGRENEVVATAAAVTDSGADLVDVSLPPRMIGPVARAEDAPVVVRAGSADQALAAARAGADLVLVPAGLVAELSGAQAWVALDTPVAVVTDDVAGIADARTVAEQFRVPLAIDSTGAAAADAIGAESMAIAEGCRLVRTRDVRRSRRVAEVMGALLGARRPTSTPTEDSATPTEDSATPADDSEDQP